MKTEKSIMLSVLLMTNLLGVHFLHARSRERTIKETIPVADSIHTLEISGKIAESVIITGWDENKIEIINSTKASKSGGKINIDALIDSIKFSHEITNDTIKLLFQYMEITEPIRLDDRLDIKLPKKLRLVFNDKSGRDLKLDVHNVHGGIEINGTFLTITVDNEKLCGNFNVDASRAHANVFIAKECKKPVAIDFQTDFGNLELHLPQILGDIFAKTSSADISISVHKFDKDLIKNLKIKAKEKALRSNFLDVVYYWSEAEKGISRINKNGLYSIEIDSAFGNVEFNKSN